MVGVVVVVVVIVEMRLMQSSFDTFVRIPNGDGAPVLCKVADYSSLAWGAEEKLKETDKIRSVLSVTNVLRVPRCAASQEAETERETVGRRGKELLVIADIGCVCDTRICSYNNNYLLQGTDSLRIVR